MNKISLPDIPAFCQTRDDLFLLYAREARYESKAAALEDGRLNLRRRIMASIVDEYNGPPKKPTFKLPPGKLWSLYVRTLFAHNFLSDAFNDALNHKLAAFILEITLERYLDHLPKLPAPAVIRHECHIRSGRTRTSTGRKVSDGTTVSRFMESFKDSQEILALGVLQKKYNLR